MQFHTLHFVFVVALLAGGSSAHAQSVLAEYHGSIQSSSLGQLDDAEMTPDGRYLITRVSQGTTRVHIFDATSGDHLHTYNFGTTGLPSGVAHDAVAVTNDRAVVIGNPSRIIDLSNLGAPELAVMDNGQWPRDLEITPDGTHVAIRGGSGATGGLFIYDLSTGSPVAQAPGVPMPYGFSTQQFDVDSVAVTNRYAAFVSSPQAVETRVTIMDLQPSGGGNPVVVYETGPGGDQDLMGTPHDITMTPDGTHLVVRSEMVVALFNLMGSTPQMSWVKRLYGNPGPMGYAAMDSVEVTNDRIATISRWSVAGFGTQVDVFDLAGNRRYQVIEGDPHDFDISSNGRRLIVRTHTSVYLYGLEAISGGLHLNYLSKQDSLGTHTSYGAGYDSVQMTTEHAVTISRVDETTDIRIWEFGSNHLKEIGQHTMDARPVDLAVTPSGDRALVSGFAHYAIMDLVSGEALLDESTSHLTGGYGWCDGAIANDTRAIAFGALITSANSPGWLTVVDLFDEPINYCGTNANSTGEEADTHANGSASVAQNDLSLVASDLPNGARGAFLYGDGQVNNPFGGGVLCVGGQSGYFAPQAASAGGVAILDVDSANLPFGTPAIVVGSTRNFQFIFRDNAAGQVNTSGGLSVTFTL